MRHERNLKESDIGARQVNGLNARGRLRTGYQPRSPEPVDPRNLKPPKVGSAVQPPRNGAEGNSSGGGR